GVESVLRVDEACDSAVALSVGDRVQRECRLARRLRAVDLDDTAARQPTDSESNVECDRTSGDERDGRALLTAEPHDGALAELAVDLGEGGFQRFFTICCRGHFELLSASLSVCLKAAVPSDADGARLLSDSTRRVDSYLQRVRQYARRVTFTGIGEPAVHNWYSIPTCVGA